MIKTLCESCSHYVRMKFRNGREKHNCRLMGPLKSSATECRKWVNVNLPDIQDMYACTWILEKRRPTGFVREEADFRPPNPNQAIPRNPGTAVGPS